MTALTVTTRGQVTFRKDVLKHLGIRPGGKIKLDLMPGGRAELRADQPEGSWDDLRDFFAGKTNGARLSIEDLDDAIAEAGAGGGHVRHGHGVKINVDTNVLLRLLVPRDEAQQTRAAETLNPPNSSRSVCIPSANSPG